MIHVTASIPVRKAGYQWKAHPYTVEEVQAFPSYITIWHRAGEIPILTGASWQEDRAARKPDPRLFRLYDPLREEPALFRIFADLGGRLPYIDDDREAPSPEQLEQAKQVTLPFFDQHGVPGKPEWGPMLTEYACTPDEGALYVTCVATTQMRAAVRLWDAVQSKNRDVLREFLAWDGGWDIRKGPLVQGLDYTMGLPENWMSRPNDDKQLVKTGTELLDKLIAAKLKHGLHPVPFRLPQGALELRVVVTELTTALWFQFADAIAENKRVRYCGREGCEKPFVLSPESARTNRLFCSNTCRVKAYQRRQAKARRMRKAGKHLRAIAKEVGTDLVLRFVSPQEVSLPGGRAVAGTGGVRTVWAGG